MAGREPVERHEHYDAEGVLMGFTLVRRDPEFTSADRSLLLASRAIDAEVTSHGIPIAEAMDPANQFAFVGPEAPEVDYADKAWRDKQDAYYKRFPEASRHGHRWGNVKRRDS